MTNKNKNSPNKSERRCIPSGREPGKQVQTGSEGEGVDSLTGNTNSPNIQKTPDTDLKIEERIKDYNEKLRKLAESYFNQGKLSAQKETAEKVQKLKEEILKRIKNSYSSFMIRNLNEKGEFIMQEYRTEYTEKEWVIKFIQEEFDKIFKESEGEKT